MLIKLNETACFVLNTQLNIHQSAHLWFIMKMWKWTSFNFVVIRGKSHIISCYGSLTFRGYIFVKW